jgi:uncharacterized protein (TIGR00369 family)
MVQMPAENRDGADSSPGGGSSALDDEQDVIDRMPLLKFLGLRVVPSPSPDVHSVTMDLGANAGNVRGVVHGGAVATLIDHCAGNSANVLLGRGGPTVDMHIRYLTTPRDSKQLRADARIVRAGRTLVIIECDVHDEGGRLVATGSVAVAPSPPPGLG